MGRCQLSTLLPPVLGPVVPLFPLPGRPVPHPALGDWMVRPAAPTDEANATPASPWAGGAAPLGAGPLTPPRPAMFPAVPPTPAVVLAATKTSVAAITTALLPTTLDPEVGLAPPPAIEACSPAAPSRSGGRLTFFASALERLSVMGFLVDIQGSHLEPQTTIPMAGHPKAPADRTLADVPRHPGHHPVVYPPAPSHRPHHPQASGGSGGSDLLCLSGAQPFESLPSTADSRSVPGPSPRQSHLSTHSPTSPPCPANLGGSQYLGLCPSLSGHSAPSRPLDGRFPLRVGSPPPSSRGLLGDSSLGRSSSGGPPGLADQLPSAAVGVSLPSDAVACNCLSIDWNGFANIYAFPPAGLILTLLPLIRGSRGRLVLVAPWDPQAPWLPLLLQQARDHLHLRTTPYQFCGQGQVFHRLGTSARWAAFTEGPFSLPSSGGGRYTVGELPSLLSASAGSRLDSLSSLVTPLPFIGHQRRRPGLPAVPLFFPVPRPYHYP